MTENMGYMEEKIREIRRIRTGKVVVDCVEAMVGKNNFLVLFEDLHRRYMSSILIFCVCSKGPTPTPTPSQK